MKLLLAIITLCCMQAQGQTADVDSLGWTRLLSDPRDIQMQSRFDHLGNYNTLANEIRALKSRIRKLDEIHIVHYETKTDTGGIIYIKGVYHVVPPKPNLDRIKEPNQPTNGKEK
jgi:hypothetical protein